MFKIKGEGETKQSNKLGVSVQGIINFSTIALLNRKRSSAVGGVRPTLWDVLEGRWSRRWSRRRCSILGLCIGRLPRGGNGVVLSLDLILDVPSFLLSHQFEVQPPFGHQLVMFSSLEKIRI